MSTDSSDDPLWYKDAVIYQLHVRSFFDQNEDGVGDFAGLTSKLDYIERLGVSAIWLLPFYPSPMRDDGYDIADYLGINPVYGTQPDFQAFVRAAHDRGLKIITELVVNHTSDQHPWFQAARAAPRGSPERDLYVWSDTDKRFPETRIIFTDTEQSNWAWDPVAGQYYWHRFFSHQPDLNHNNPAVVSAVTRVMQHWLDLGVDGLRLDAIPYLCVRDGTTNENLPETHAVVKRFRSAVDARYKNRMLLAEANQWPEDVREYFGDGDECHMAYHFPLMPRMYMAIAQEDRYPIVEILQQTPDIPPTCQWAIFLRNHDELTLEMVTDKERDYMYQMYAADRRARVNVGIRRRLAPLMENDPAKIQLMNSLLLSMPGSPTVYYGDELGMGDNIYLGDRNSVRTPMQWSPDRNGGFSRSDPQSLYLPPIMDPVYGYASVNVEAQSREPSSLLNWTRRMLAVRKTSKAFGRGTFELLRPGNRTILAYVRRYENQAILCVANLKRSAQAVELNLAQFRGRVPVEMIGRSSFPPIGELPYMLTLPGHAFYWFDLAESAPPPSWHEEHPPPEERPWLVLSNGLDSFQAGPDGRQGAAAKLLAQLEREVVPSYLPTQRWFAGKSQGAPSVTITDIGRWQLGQETWLLLVASAQFSADASQEYFLPLALEWGSERAGPHVPQTLARVRQRSATGILVDAFADERFVRALLTALSEGASVRIGSGTLRFTPTSALGALLPNQLAQAPVRHTAESSNLTFVIGEQLFLKAFRRLRGGVAPRVGARPFPHGALAMQRCAGDGRRDRARTTASRADDDRPRASRRPEPGRRLEIHVALPRAQPRRRTGARSERYDRRRGSLELPSARSRACTTHRRLAPGAGRQDGGPELRSRAVHGGTRRRVGCRDRQRARCDAAQLARTAHRAPNGSTRGRRPCARYRATAARRDCGPRSRADGSPRDSPAWRLSPRASADHEERLRHHGSRGRAWPQLGGAPAQAHRAQGPGRDAALVRLRAHRRRTPVLCETELGGYGCRRVPR